MRLTTIPGRLRRFRGGEATTQVRPDSSSAAAPAQPPKQVAQYQLERAIGTGGQGDVYAAWDTLLLRPVALKRIRQDADDPEPHVAEARHSAGLRHAAFVRIFGVVNDASGHWIVMERVFGRELSALIQDGPMATPEAIDLMTQAAQAMAEVHDRGLAHGDIKPSNLMVQSNGDLRILDFGIANAFHGNRGASAVDQGAAGTRAYMAPERLSGSPPTPASDLFALGAVMLEMLGGHRPAFTEPNWGRSATGCRQAGSDAWSFPPTLPAPLVDLIRDMGATDETHRPASMESVARALQALKPTGERRGGRASRPWSSAGLLVALAVLGGLVSGDGPSPARPPPARITSDQEDMRAGIAAMGRFDEDGAIARAVGHFEAVVTRSPRHAAAAAWLALAHCVSYRNDGQREVVLARASEAAARAMALDDQLGVAQAAQGWTQELQGHAEAALLHYDRALRLDPDNVYATNGKVSLLARQRQFDAALALATQARARHPQDRMYADLVGWLHFEHGDMAAAERAFRASIEVQRDAVFAYANLNAALLRLGRPEEALQVLQQGLQIRPAGRLYTNLGAALYARGDYPAAAEAFKAAVEGPHGNPQYFLRWANLADALRWTPGQTEASAAAYRRALDLFQPTLAREQSPVNLSRAAVYEAKLGLRDQAAGHLALLEAAPPKQPDPNFRMAMAYEVMGRREQALQSLRRAVALGYPIALVESEPEFRALRRDSGDAALIPESQEPISKPLFKPVSRPVPP